jgi:hypothetical protein
MNKLATALFAAVILVTGSTAAYAQNTNSAADNAAAEAKFTAVFFVVVFCLLLVMGMIIAQIVEHYSQEKKNKQEAAKAPIRPAAPVETPVVVAPTPVVVAAPVAVVEETLPLPVNATETQVKEYFGTTGQKSVAYKRVVYEDPSNPVNIIGEIEGKVFNRRKLLYVFQSKSGEVYECHRRDLVQAAMKALGIVEAKRQGPQLVTRAS